MTTLARPKRKAAKITISLPADLLDAVDQRQQERGESRSEVIRGAVEELFRQERERADEARWIQSHRDHPQAEDEIGGAAASLAAWQGLPWEDDPAPNAEHKQAATAAG